MSIEDVNKRIEEMKKERREKNRARRETLRQLGKSDAEIDKLIPREEGDEVDDSYTVEPGGTVVLGDNPQKGLDELKEENEDEPAEILPSDSPERDEYFRLKKERYLEQKKRIPDDQSVHKDNLTNAEVAYMNFKERKVKELMTEPDGKQKAREFLFGEVELKRKFERENKLVGKSERLKSALSRGIEAWDKWGTEKGPKRYVKRVMKAGVSLTLIGLTSSWGVENLSKIGVGSATAIGGDISSYLLNRIGIGASMAAIISAIPEKHRKWAGLAMMSASALIPVLSGAGAVAGLGVVGASAFGYGLSHLTKRYDKKIKTRIEKTKSEIKWDEAEDHLAEIERKIENILKQSEITRITGKAIEAVTAIVGSMAYLEVAGAIQDSSSEKGGHENKDEEPEKIINKKPFEKLDKIREESAEQRHQDLLENPAYQEHLQKMAEHHQAELEVQQENAESISKFQEEVDKVPLRPEHAEKSETHTDTSESKPDASVSEDIENDQKNLQFKTEKGEIVNSDAVVHKGEGIETALARQIENNPDLAKALGYKGDINDADALHQFAGKEAHVLAEKEGYADQSVNEADKTAYEIKSENGEITIEKKDVSSEEIRSEYVDTSKESTGESGTEEHQAYEFKKEGGYQPDQQINIENTQPSPQITSGGEMGTRPFSTYALLNPEEMRHQANEVFRLNLENIYSEIKNLTGHEVHIGDIKLNAAEITDQKLDDVRAEYMPIVSYIQELEKTTGIHPIRDTHLHPAETATEYINRVLQTSAEKGVLLKASIDDHGLTHMEELPLSQQNIEDLSKNDSNSSQTEASKEINIIKTPESLDEFKKLSVGQETDFGNLRLVKGDTNSYQFRTEDGQTINFSLRSEPDPTGKEDMFGIFDKNGILSTDKALPLKQLICDNISDKTSGLARDLQIEIARNKVEVDYIKDVKFD